MTHAHRRDGERCPAPFEGDLQMSWGAPCSPDTGRSLTPPFPAPSRGQATLTEPRAGGAPQPSANPAWANASSPMLTRLNPPFALQTEAAAPGMPTAASPGRRPLAGALAMPAAPQRLPARTGAGGIGSAVGTHRYSRENLVSSRLLCSHLNSRGQLPSAMHVRTRRFPSRWTWLRTGSVLKYGETSSAGTGGKGGQRRAWPQSPPAP